MMQNIMVSSTTINLKAELKKLMFTGDKKPAPVSNDPAKFTMVMSILTNYEKNVSMGTVQ